MSHELATELCRFIDASPSPFHLTAVVARRLEAAGLVRADEIDAWSPEADGAFVIRGGTLIAWRWPDAPADGFRIVAGHTDSPNLRVKQHPDRPDGTIGLDPYGGVLLESWLDRDLKVAGRVVHDGGAVSLIDTGEPLLRVPRLAIHLSDESTKLDRQRHLNAVWSGDSLLPWLAERAGLPEIVGFDLMTSITEPSALVGDWIAAPRLDNQATCFAALEAFLGGGGPGSVLALFDHEEIGSTSERGAQSDMLRTVLERIVVTVGGDRSAFFRATAASLCVSGDMAHASHPSFPDRHEPSHRIDPKGGPVLKVNVNQRYATDGVGAEFFARACADAQVPMQRYVHRADLPCGSTIGPMSSARTGITTVDVGAPQLAMHSARETMALVAIEQYTAALTSAYRVDARV